jgi:hypothetical protein
MKRLAKKSQEPENLKGKKHIPNGSTVQPPFAHRFNCFNHGHRGKRSDPNAAGSGHLTLEIW